MARDGKTYAQACQSLLNVSPISPASDEVGLVDFDYALKTSGTSRCSVCRSTRYVGVSVGTQAVHEPPQELSPVLGGQPQRQSPWLPVASTSTTRATVAAQRPLFTLL